MESVDEIYKQVKDGAEDLYSQIAPEKFLIGAASAGVATYAVTHPSSPETFNTLGHLAVGSTGSSFMDIAYDVLEPEHDETTRKLAMVTMGLACGEITQGAQAAGIVPGDYDASSVAQAGLAATASALGTEEYRPDASYL